jgi:hypothetical protein
MTKATKRVAGVMLDPDVIDFLAQLAGREGRNRSWLINFIIRLYAQQLLEKQRPVPPPSPKVISY